MLATGVFLACVAAAAAFAGENCDPSKYPVGSATQYCSDEGNGYLNAVYYASGNTCYESGSAVMTNVCDCACYCTSDIQGPGCPTWTCPSKYNSQISNCFATVSNCTSCGPGFYTTGCGCHQEGSQYVCSAGTCQPCSSGTYSHGGILLSCTKCSTCSSGQYISTTCDQALGAADSVCSPCPPGYYCFDGTDKTQCEPSYYCPGGTTWHVPCCNSAKTTSLQHCPMNGEICERFVSTPGYSFSNSTDPCGSGAICPMGTYSPTFQTAPSCAPYDAKLCLPCPIGYYGKTEGASACTPCAPGSSMNLTGSYQCTPCKPGFYAEDSASISCTPCAAGTYSTQMSALNISTCQTCLAGSYASSPGSQACEACEVGKYTPYYGATQCEPCPANTMTFALSVGVSTDILYESYAVIPGAPGQIACINCPKGFFANSTAGTCQRCELGVSYSPAGIPYPCSVPLPEYFVATSCQYYTDAVILNCTKCALGVTYETVPCQAGGAVNVDRKCMQCDNNCSGDPGVVNFKKYVTHACNLTSNTQCANCNESLGHMLPGGMCSPCPYGTYFNESQRRCLLCPGGTFSNTANAPSCTPCAQGKTSGPGSGMCTAMCGSGQFAPDGVHCVPVSSGVTRDVVWDGPKLINSFAAGAMTFPSGVIVVANSFDRARGELLWATEGTSYILAGSMALPLSVGLLTAGGPGVDVIFCVISSLSTLTSDTLLLTDYCGNCMQNTSATCTGALRVVTVTQQGEPQVNVQTLASGASSDAVPLLLQKPADAAPAAGGGIWFVDEKNTCVFSIQVGGGAFSCVPNTVNAFLGARAISTVQTTDLTSGVAAVVLDSIAVWCLDADGDVYSVPLAMNFESAVIDVSIWPDEMGGRVFLLFENAVTSVPLASALSASSTSLQTQVIQGASATYQAFMEAPYALYLTGSASGGYGVVQQLETGGIVACGAGLYAYQGQCVQAPVGGYSPAWSSAAQYCYAGQIGRVPGATSSADACLVCPPGFTTYTAGSVSCVRSCSGGTVWDSTTQTCTEGCNASKGLYRDTVQDICVPCWAGTQPQTNGIAGCVLCEPGTFYMPPGQCLPCQNGTTTIARGVAMCMPTYDHQTEPSWMYDGLGVPPSLTLLTAGPEAQAAAVVVTSGGEGLMVGAGGRLWAVVGGAWSLRVNWNVSAFDLLALSDAQDYLYTAAIGGSCVYRVTLSNVTWTPTPFAGTCNAPSSSALGSILSIALSESDGFVPTLFVSGMRSGSGVWQSTSCASILAVSTQDGSSVSIFADPEPENNPRVVMQACQSSLMLGAERSTGVLAASETLGTVYSAPVDSTANSLDGFLGQDTPTMVIPSNDPIDALAAMPVGVLIGITHGGQLWVNTEGQIARIPVSNSSSTGRWGVAAVGRRAYVAQLGAGGRINVSVVGLPSMVTGCAGGFVAWTGNACMQTGVGQVATAAGVLSVCPAGTFGTRAGAYSVAAHCSVCPEGTQAPAEGSTICDPCGAGQISLGDRTGCVAPPCPTGSYVSASMKSCVACGPGYTSQPGAMSWSDCRQCSAGTYSNASTQGLCLPCPSGYTSPANAIHCVPVCGQNQCSQDGETCMANELQYNVMTQITTQGSTLVAITVDSWGYVFYSDGTNVMHYYDNCSHVSTGPCVLSGDDLVTTDTTVRVPSSVSSAGYVPLSSLSLSAFAYCQRSFTGPSPSCMYIRKLYMTSTYLHVVLSLDVCVDYYGNVDVLQTSIRAGQGVGLNIVAGWPNLAGGFMDGAATSAMFNFPVELAITSDCTRLYISDLYNNRVRMLQTQSGVVSTVVGFAGSVLNCWQSGNVACSFKSSWTCGGTGTGCASVNWPAGIGLSSDENDLYIVSTLRNSLFIVYGVRDPSTAVMEEVCQYSEYMQYTGSVMSCSLTTPGSQSCPMHVPFDVVAFGRTAFVGWTQGITAINVDVFSCTQVAGEYFSIAAGLVDGPGPAFTNAPTSKMMWPFRLVIASQTGILYFVDRGNGVIRRILVRTSCTCPPGLTLLPTANSCYNPSPLWQQGSLTPQPTCPQGQYLMPGNAGCASCDDQLFGSQAAECVLQQTATSLVTTVSLARSYAQIDNVPEPVGAPLADWFAMAPPATFSWDSMFNAGVTYALPPVAGRAPWGSEYLSVAWQPRSSCWQVDRANPPRRLLPGIWFACSTSVQADAANCDCPANVGAFNKDDSSSDRVGRATWHSVRLGAYVGGGRSLRPGIAAGTNTMTQPSTLSLSELASGVRGYGDTSVIMPWSRFMMLGSKDVPAPNICGEAAAADGGSTCFEGWMHFQADYSSMADNFFVNVYADNPLATPSAWHTAGIQGNLGCYSGWPSHYACPDGFMWVGPGTPLTSDMCDMQTTPSLVTCISCMPGYYSYTDPASKVELGGPYACAKCDTGYYSSNAGASMCLPCPDGWYANTTGSTACYQCSNNTKTGFSGAWSINQCTMCAAGTGSCKSCPEGEYQSYMGQYVCLVAPPGSYASGENNTHATACPAGTFQSEPGRTSCVSCPIFTYTTVLSGATACTSCIANNTCGLAIGNVCGTGCGLNKYFDVDTMECVTCPNGTINADDTCAVGLGACEETTRRDYYLLANGSVAKCPDGTQAKSDYLSCEACPRGTFSAASVGTTSCTTCPAGVEAQSSGASACTPCLAGYYNDGSGDGLCMPCALGSFTGCAGKKACDGCPAGTYAPSTGMSACSFCPPGLFSNTSNSSTCAWSCDARSSSYVSPGGTACVQCVGLVNASSDVCAGCGYGRYFIVLNNGNLRECLQCPPGTVSLVMFGDGPQACAPCANPVQYASGDGSMCINASDGYMPNSNRTGQVACPAGTIRPSNVSSCTSCPAGTYSPVPASSACLPCSRGYFTDQAGMSACSPCKSYTIAPNMGTSQCGTCPAGQQPTPDRTGCVVCTANTFSTQGDPLGCQSCSVQNDAWVSPPNSSTCGPCPSGTVYSPKYGGSCGGCGSGTYYADATCVLCEEGKYFGGYGAMNASSCQPCPGGTIAESKGSSSCHACDAGTYPSSPYSCDGCLPGQGGVNCPPCAPGTFAMGYSTPNCTRCAAGKYTAGLAGSTECQPCPPGSFTASTGWAGQTCTPCPRNTFSDSYGSSACAPKTSTCSPGQYLALNADPSKDNVCTACTACGPDQITVYQAFHDISFYIEYGQSCTEANRLRQPETTQSTQFVVIPDYVAFSNQLYLLCNGNTTYPGYTCLPATSTAGTYYVYTQGSVGASGSDIVTALANAYYKLINCPQLSSDQSLLLQYVVGPNSLSCFMSCMYGILAPGVTVYANAMQSQSSSLCRDSEQPSQNLFCSSVIPYATTVCAQCPDGACTTPGTFRPAANGVCGPPCGLPSGNQGSYQAACSGTGGIDGCISSCLGLPGNATFVTGSNATGNAYGCSWVCNAGFHLRDDRLGCMPCVLPNADAVALYCQGQNYALVDAAHCQPGFTRVDMCKRCQRLSNARSALWDWETSSCSYICDVGYFLSGSNAFGNGTGLQCVACVGYHLVSPCGIGEYMDEESCVLYGTMPQCKPCASSVTSYFAFTTNGGANVDSCHAICTIGFHTVQVSTQVYYDTTNASQALGPLSVDLACLACRIGDTRACEHIGCSPGFWRNTLIPYGQPNGCVPCTQMQDCPSGSYAIACNGNETHDPGCRTCPPLARNLNMQYVPNSELHRLTVIAMVGTGCPAACINNYVLAQTGRACVPCNANPCPSIGFQPSPKCSFIYSHWNATPAAPWWDVMHNTPTQLLATAIADNWGSIWPRAGWCWACPPGTGTSEFDTDLCQILPGFSAEPSPSVARPPIPTLPADLAVVLQEPRPARLYAGLYGSGARRRALLQAANTTTESTATFTVNISAAQKFTQELAVPNASAVVVGYACPYGTYKPGSGPGVCSVCPTHASTTANGSSSETACTCNYGSYALPNGACLTCPVDTAGSKDKPGGNCTPCSVNETTFGLSGQVSCACRLGYMRNATGSCELCDAGMYCSPCYNDDPAPCPLGSRPTVCFYGSSSLPGSWDISNCTCPPGQTRLQRGEIQDLFYCDTLPVGSHVDWTGNVVCMPGWTTVSTFPTVQCKMCEPGQYAVESAPGVPHLDANSRPTCVPCPQGSYSASTAAIGSNCCIQCPETTTTQSSGATSFSECMCPGDAGIDPTTGRCRGCTTLQFRNSSSGKCQDCPDNSQALTPALSLNDCACVPGYQRGVPPNDAQFCVPCPQGTFSSTLSLAKCTPCSKGSTTAGTGATSRRACGATPDLCDIAHGYAWSSQGCFKLSS